MILSVVIPTHNRSDALALTLENLKLQQFDEKWEVIVINNNCTDNTNKIIFNLQKDFPVCLKLICEKKRGAAAARNAGARVAKGQYLVFIDNDILVESNFLEKHIKALREHPASWIVGQIINLPEQERSVFGKYRKELFPVLPKSHEPREVYGFTGANSSIPRTDFERVDGFNENFYVASSEDQELLMRARIKLGIKAILIPSLLVTHNDWAGWTFKDFCVRQSKYAETEYVFWKKYGNDHPRLQLVHENLPINYKSDSVLLMFRKAVKKGLGFRLAQFLLINLSLLMEKIFPFKPVLWRLYKLTLAGAIHRGFREGMRIYEET